MIDRYIILTIPRSVKRHWAMIGGAAAMRVPEDKLFFYAGVSAENYQNDMKEVAKAASAEGYTFLNQFAIGLKSAWVQQSAGNVALFWNWARILEWIAASGETVLLTWDDRILTVPFSILEKVVSELYSRPEPFYIFQLRLRAGWDHLQQVGRMEYKQNDSVPLETDFFIRSVYADIENYHAAYLQNGLLGYDESMVFSPRGASWLLEQMFLMEDLTDELVDFQFKDIELRETTPETLEARQRSRLNNDNWLWYGNLESVKKALSDRKGLYCPKRIGYAFIDEPLQMGTNVHWNTEILETYGIEKQASVKFMEI